jgi:hypothetical protein
MKNFIGGAVTLMGWMLGRSGRGQVVLMRRMTVKSARRASGGRAAYEVSLEAWHEPAPALASVD